MLQELHSSQFVFITVVHPYSLVYMIHMNYFDILLKPTQITDHIIFKISQVCWTIPPKEYYIQYKKYFNFLFLASCNGYSTGYSIRTDFWQKFLVVSNDFG